MKKKFFKNKIKRLIGKHFIVTLMLCFICTTYLFIPNDWGEGNPPTLIFEYREIGNYLLNNLENLLICEECIKKEEAWTYTRSNGISTGISVGDSISISIKRSNGTIELIE